MTKHQGCCPGPHQTCRHCQGDGRIPAYRMAVPGCMDNRIVVAVGGSSCRHCKQLGFFCRARGTDCPGDTDCVPEIDLDRCPPV